MYATPLLRFFTTPRLPVLIVLGFFVYDELRGRGSRATLDHVDTHEIIAQLLACKPVRSRCVCLLSLSFLDFIRGVFLVDFSGDFLLIKLLG